MENGWRKTIATCVLHNYVLNVEGEEWNEDFEYDVTMKNMTSLKKRETTTNVLLPYVTE